MYKEADKEVFYSFLGMKKYFSLRHNLSGCRRYISLNLTTFFVGEDEMLLLLFLEVNGQIIIAFLNTQNEDSECVPLHNHKEAGASVIS